MSEAVDWGHFPKKVMACSHCGKIGPLLENLKALLAALERLRLLAAGRKVVVHCAYRCPAWNADPQVGGAANSFHLQAMAVDLHIEGLKISEMADLARKAGFRGIGLYPNWYTPGIHADLGPIRTWIK